MLAVLPHAPAHMLSCWLPLDSFFQSFFGNSCRLELILQLSRQKLVCWPGPNAFSKEGLCSAHQKATVATAPQLTVSFLGDEQTLQPVMLLFCVYSL